MKRQICVIGLGHIGLPIACILAVSGHAVLGVDTDQRVVSRVQSKDASLSEPGLCALLKQAIESGHLTVSTQVAPADVFIIAVPTSIDASKRPDISCVQKALDSIRPHLTLSDLILVESTCPIGTTEILAKEVTAHMAYCPERVIPGRILHELIHNDRVVGGIDEVSTEKAVAFYRSFVQGEVIATDTRTAEAVKLAENCYRDINIAYANELSMISDRMQIDVNEVIRLANRHPRVQILQPGPGVGGYCITVNPWFLASSAPDLALVTTKAREVNLQKTNWAIRKIQTAIADKRASMVACLGMTYKADACDVRDSVACIIINEIEKEAKVLRVDPYVQGALPLYDALARAEIVVGLVAHKEFLNIPTTALVGKTVLDFAGIFL